MMDGYLVMITMAMDDIPAGFYDSLQEAQRVANTYITDDVATEAVIRRAEAMGLMTSEMVGVMVFHIVDGLVDSVVLTRVVEDE